MQKGSLVAPDRLRFDFSHMKSISESELDKINDIVNQIVDNKSDVITRLMTPKEGMEHGALALFGEKYGEEVRVVFMGEEGNKYFSTELCGGTHVRNTSEVGKFKIVSQSAIAAGVRRVEALRDIQLDKYLQEKEKNINLSTQKDEENINNLLNQIKKLGGEVKITSDDKKLVIKDLTRQLDRLNIKSVLEDKSKNIVQDFEINKVKVRFQKVSNLSPKDLRKLVDEGKNFLKKGIVVVSAHKDNKVGLAVGITENLTNKYDAVKLAKVGSEIIGGKGGGGRKDFAQSGGNLVNKIDDAFNEIKGLI
jgi:alanyl-tRNA synthetase